MKLSSHHTISTKVWGQGELGFEPDSPSKHKKSSSLLFYQILPTEEQLFLISASLIFEPGTSGLVILNDIFS